MSRTDLDINAGETTALALTLKDENGDPIDLTTCTRLELAAKRNVDDTEYLFRKTLGGGVVITDAAGGLATVTIAAADTLDLDDGAYPYDVQLVLSTGRFRALRGDLNVDSAVNRT
jgi:hypothetical protein